MKDYTQVSKEEILSFVGTLSSNDEFKMTNDDFRQICKFVECDGCSVVPDFYKTACSAHDFRYATHRDFNGEPITRAKTDALFRKHIQSKSKLGIFSPMSYWRWAGVRLFGGIAWEDIK